MNLGRCYALGFLRTYRRFWEDTTKDQVLQSSMGTSWSTSHLWSKGHTAISGQAWIVTQVFKAKTVALPWPSEVDLLGPLDGFINGVHDGPPHQDDTENPCYASFPS